MTCPREKKIAAMRSEGLGCPEIARKLKTSTSSVYRIAKKLEAKQHEQSTTER